MGHSIDDTPAPSNAENHSSAFIPPSIDMFRLFAGESYSHYSKCPLLLPENAENCLAVSRDSSVPNTPTYFVLGVDEAGRGPVLGPMVYSAFYVPHHLHRSLLTKDYTFDDSKILTPGVRLNLMRLLCTPGNSLFGSCGWATKLLSAQDISSGMLRPGAAAYNLNAQAMDATVEIIREIIEDRKVDVREVFIDTIGNPVTYQQKLERIFPNLKITVAKKADSLYPCVSAASVVAKVTRDIALELCYDNLAKAKQHESSIETWGSGYPSDTKCVNWLRKTMEPLFGWGNECRFSWGTAKEMLELKGGTRVDWPSEEENSQLKEFFLTRSEGSRKADHELPGWFGHRPADVL